MPNGRLSKKKIKSLKIKFRRLKNLSARQDLGTAITQVDDVEQYTRKHNLQIQGIAETADEDIAENVVKLGKVVNVHISPSIVTEWDLGTAAAPNLLLFGLNHIRRKLSCTKLGNI